MSWPDIIAIVIVVAIVLLPPRWDPAIRFKEWNEKRRKQ